MPTTATPVLTQGKAEKASGDTLRFPLDVGDDPLLIAGFNIVAKSVSTTGTGAPSLSGLQLDYRYQVSCLISGGSPGTYGIAFSVTLDDPDASVISRTGILTIY